MWEMLFDGRTRANASRPKSLAILWRGFAAKTLGSARVARGADKLQQCAPGQTNGAACDNARRLIKGGRGWSKL